MHLLQIGCSYRISVLHVNLLPIDDSPSVFYNRHLIALQVP
nr:MAG TPA: hypothetical protein [Caudoviricetes sp.]